MSPEVPIVDCGPFCAVGFSRTIDKSEFSHSLDRFVTCRRAAQTGHSANTILDDLVGRACHALRRWEAVPKRC
jgi:hypothetical protein